MTIRWRKVAFPLLVVAAILIFARSLSPVLTPVLLAALAAVVLNPVVDFAARLGMPRVATVILLYVVAGFLVAVAGSGLVGQFEALRNALQGEPLLLVSPDGLVDHPDEFIDLNGNGEFDPGALKRLEGWVTTQLDDSDSDFLGSTVDELRQSFLKLLGDFARPAGEVVGQMVDSLTQWAGGVVALITLLVLIPFYLFFFLAEYAVMSRRLHLLVPPRYREQVDRVTGDIGRELVAFLRGRLLCGAVKALMLWVGMMFLGIPYALPIALVSGLLSLVPFAGFLAGVLPASVIALTMPGGGTELMLYAVGLFVTAEAIEGAVLFPLLLGKETGLHPVMIVVVLLAGGSLMGTVGVIVAIPLALICKVGWRELGQPLYQAWANPPEDDDAEPQATAAADASGG